MEKINIAELLKDCPKGMELDCTMFDGVYFDHVDDLRHNSIKCYVNNGNEHFEIALDEHGQYISNKSAKCVIFPKGKTTWEGFQRPFRDGDVVAVTMYPEGTWIGIFKQYEKTSFEAHCCLNAIGEYYIGSKNHSLTGVHLATEEEKEKLFQAIKDNGYRWNEETKALEKLIEPKFKVGDRIRHKCPEFRGERIIKNCNDTGYFTTINDWIGYKNQDDWELIPDKFDINTLIPFESRVLARDNEREEWHPALWGFYDVNSDYPYKLIGDISRYCIPYEGNQHLLGTTDDCDEYFKTWE